MKRWFWILDVAVVLSFVVIGRDTHGFVSDWAATLRVAAPFLFALSIGIGLTRAWERPTRILTGLGISITTVVVGLGFRKYVFDAGTATTFVILTSAWMIVWMAGWRLVANPAARIIDSRRGSVTT
ncbi:MAG: DUF3054 domain-containing protein [Actinomycetia bacterium]|nr:DUF3054 domain-containing protein [Actinomycetes bacterium]